MNGHRTLPPKVVAWAIGALVSTIGAAAEATYLAYDYGATCSDFTPTQLSQKSCVQMRIGVGLCDRGHFACGEMCFDPSRNTPDTCAPTYAPLADPAQVRQAALNQGNCGFWDRNQQAAMCRKAGHWVTAYCFDDAVEDCVEGEIITDNPSPDAGVEVDAGPNCSAGLMPCGATCYDPAAQVCVGGIACPLGHGECGGRCYDLSTQICASGVICPLGFGACGGRCFDPVTQVCLASGVICAVGQAECNGTCFDPATQVCSSGHLCAIGEAWSNCVGCYVPAAKGIGESCNKNAQCASDNCSNSNLCPFGGHCTCDDDGDCGGGGMRCATWTFKTNECVLSCSSDSDCPTGEECKKPIGTSFHRCK